MNEKDIENKINEITEKYKKNKVTKEKFLKEQIKLMKYALENLNLSRTKRTYIKNALRLCELTYSYMRIR